MTKERGLIGTASRWRLATPLVIVLYAALVFVVAFGSYRARHISDYVPLVNVRWSPEVTAELRASLEKRFSLTQPESTADRTWIYVLGDTSQRNIRAIVEFPTVEDTHRIDRGSYLLTEPVYVLGEVVGEAARASFILVAATCALGWVRVRAKRIDWSQHAGRLRSYADWLRSYERRRPNLSVFIALLLASAVLQVFLAATVTNIGRLDDDRREGWLDDRFTGVLQDWAEHGYFRQGGMWVFERGGQTYAYRSYPMTFVLPQYPVQKLVHLATGEISLLVWQMYARGVLLAAGALLGLLAASLARSAGATPRQALALGVAAAAVYQTFPGNLRTAYHFYNTHVAHLLVIAFLAVEHFQDSVRRPLVTWVRSAVLVVLFWTEWLVASFILIAHLLVHSFLGWGPPTPPRIWATYVRPAAAGVGLFAMQLLYFVLRRPDVKLVGSSFMFRTGLDGSTTYYHGHMDLLWSDRPLWQLWGLLFLLAVAGLIVLARIYIRGELRGPTKLLIVAFLNYVIFGAAFSQLFAIHRYSFDQLLLIPIVLIVFATLPAVGEARTGNHGLFTLVAFCAAIVLAFVQLREFVMRYPLPTYFWRDGL